MYLYVDFSETVLFIVRVIAGVVMVYYGFPKARDLQKNAKDFEGMGFKPGMLWGTIVAVVELAGGLMIILGLNIWLPVVLFAFEMLMGMIWKISKTDKPFTDWSYDLLLLVLMLVLMAFGPGAYALGQFVL